MAKRGESASRHKPLLGGENDHDDLTLPQGVLLESSDDSLLIRFVDSGKAWDVTTLRRLGELSEPFALAVARVLAEMGTPASRHTKFETLEWGFFKFVLEDDAPPVVIGDIDRAYVTRYQKWLSAQVNGKSEQPLTRGNKIQKSGAVKRLLQHLARRFPDLDVAQIVPVNPWPDEKEERGAKTQPLDPKVLAKILDHVEQELVPLLDMVDRHFPGGLDTGDSRPERIRKSGSAEYQLCAGIVDYYDLVPHLIEITDFVEYVEEIDGVTKKVDPTVVEFCGGPTPRQLYLVMIYLLAYTGFNEQPIRDLNLSDITTVLLMGHFQTNIRSGKTRARTPVRRSFSDDPNAKISVTRVIDCVRRWTSILRRSAPESVRDKLLIYLPRTRKEKYPVGSFASSQFDKKAGTIISNHGVSFAAEIGEKYIGTRALRATVAELLHLSTDNDEDFVAAGLGHSPKETTNAHYRSKTVRDTDEWRLAGAMTLRERYFESDGRIDPRDARSKKELSAATPGWACLDNLTSPVEGQSHGRPCTAYGFCPACPHAVPVADKPYLLAVVVALSSKLSETISRIGPKAARARFGAVLSALESYREFLSRDTEVLVAAKSVRLGPLPHLE